MSKLYSIQESTLTGIGNALRSKYGETRPGTIQVPYVIAKSSNVTDLNNYGFMPSGKTYNVVRIPGATKIKVNLYYMTSSDTFGKVYVASGEYESNIPTDINYSGQTSPTLVELEFDNTEVITFCLDAMYIQALGYYAECIGYDVDGNPIEVEGCSYKEQEIEVKNTYSSADVAAAIEGLEAGLPEEAFLITGNCNYRFAYGGWNWFIERYGNKITTKDINDINSMFYMNTELENIPFEFNIKSNSNNMSNTFYGCRALKHIPNIYCKSSSYVDMSRFFQACNSLENVPYLYNAYPSNIAGMFSQCYYLREIPEDYFDTWNFSRLNSYNYAGMNSILERCYSLRKMPIKLFGYLENNTITSNYSNMYYQILSNCYVLDEVIDLAVSTSTFKSNTFTASFEYCYRLKSLTFKTNEDGSPKTANWKSQVISLNSEVGFKETNQNKNPADYATDKGSLANYTGSFTNYNSGITADKAVYDEATYQALKNDPDWFCIGTKYYPDSNYSRYNHDSAVETINSLPDTSAYLTANGGTNTIKFYGASGSATDGGAINTLTEEEIAVAAAKGWTVTLV